jgi:hypothetical protein
VRRRNYLTAPQGTRPAPHTYTHLLKFTIPPFNTRLATPTPGGWAACGVTDRGAGCSMDSSCESLSPPDPADESVALLQPGLPHSEKHRGVTDTSRLGLRQYTTARATSSLPTRLHLCGTCHSRHFLPIPGDLGACGVALLADTERQRGQLV